MKSTASPRRFKHATKANQSHTCNFVVGDTVDRPVFIVNLQTKQVVTSIHELEDAQSYCDDCFYLPSPHTHAELESPAAAAQSLHIKTERGID